MRLSSFIVLPSYGLMLFTGVMALPEIWLVLYITLTVIALDVSFHLARHKRRRECERECEGRKIRDPYWYPPRPQLLQNRFMLPYHRC